MKKPERWMPYGIVMIGFTTLAPYVSHVSAGTPHESSVIPVDAKWTPVANMSADRVAHASIRLPNGRVMVAGGAQSNTMPLDIGTTEIFDSASGWTIGPEMPLIDNDSPLHPEVLVLPGDRIAISGGDETRFQGVGVLMHILDVNTLTWVNRFVRTSGDNGYIVIDPSLAVTDGKVVIVGGRRVAPPSFPGGEVAEVCVVVDFASGCTHVATLDVARFRARSVFSQDHVIITGGVHFVDINPFQSEPIVENSVIDLNITTGEMRSLASMNLPRSGHGIVRLEDGSILVAGGRSGDAKSAWEVYDPAQNAWTHSGYLSRERYYAKLLRLKGGNVLLVSGDDQECCDIFVPSVSAWIEIGMPDGMTQIGSAVEMGDGNVLVTGAGDPNAAILDVTALSTAIASTVATPTSVSTDLPKLRRLWIPFALRYVRPRS